LIYRKMACRIKPMSLFSFKKQPKTIIFSAAHDGIEAVNLPPIPATQDVPSWYKELPRFIGNVKSPSKGSKDLKLCSPFRDALIHGYFIRLPLDVEVIIENEIPTINWNGAIPFEPVKLRGDITLDTNQAYGMPVPMGCSPYMFAWHPFWGITLPDGYSSLITHPINRYDLPFTVTNGVMDSDKFTVAGSIPFFLKEGFEGIIPRGTPIAQVFPFRREEWVTEMAPHHLEYNNKTMMLRDSHLYGYYAKFLRQKKSFK
jgi:hypothetical protein